MRHFLLLLVLLMVFISCFSQAVSYVNEEEPVGVNTGIFLSSGEMEWNLSFNLSENGSIPIVDISKVFLNGKITWKKGITRSSTISQQLVPSNAVPGLYHLILRTEEDQNSITLNKEPKNDAVWERFDVKVSYFVKGVKKTLPLVRINNNNSTTNTSTKVYLPENGLIIENKSLFFVANVSGNEAIEITKIEVNAKDENVVKEYKGVYSGLGPNFQINVPIADPGEKTYRVKLFAKKLSSEEPLEIVEQNISFSTQLTISSIDGSIVPASGYSFNLLDKKNSKFKITTFGKGELTLVNKSNSYSLKLSSAGKGVYDLDIVTMNVVFGEENGFEFYSNQIKIPGEWKFYRNSLVPAISVGMSPSNRLLISTTLPDWITGNINIKLPKRKSTFSIDNSSAVMSEKSKIFKIELKKSDFDNIDNVKDSIFSDKVVFLLNENSLMEHQFTFLNYEYYTKKLQEAQKIKDKDEKKEAIKTILNSLFSKPDGEDAALLKSIVSNLSSDKDETKKKGWDQVLSYVITLGPAVIALL